MPHSKLQTTPRSGSSLIHPIAKCPKPNTPGDFRPIGILCAFAKIFERIVFQQISSYISANSTLNALQSGFRNGHITQTALLKITEDIRNALDKRQGTILVLFHFTKAFDSVCHELPLRKLSTYLKLLKERSRLVPIIPQRPHTSSGVR
jgi:hypothetical protein